MLVIIKMKKAYRILGGSAIPAGCQVTLSEAQLDKAFGSLSDEERGQLYEVIGRTTFNELPTVETFGRPGDDHVIER